MNKEYVLAEIKKIETDMAHIKDELAKGQNFLTRLIGVREYLQLKLEEAESNEKKQ